MSRSNHRHGRSAALAAARVTRQLILVALAAILLLPLAGCGSVQSVAMPKPGLRLPPPSKIRLGILATEDALPLWVAQQGIFDKVGLTVDLVPFPSAEKRDAAFKSGAIDGFVGDIFSVAKLNDEGFKNRITIVCLGATPAQGRWGIVASPSSRLRLTSQLENVGVATSLKSTDEYVLDGLVHAIPRPWAVTKVDVENPLDRLNLVVAGKVKAAVLPEPYLSLAIRRRAHLIVDDTKGANLSQTVISLSDSFVHTPQGISAADRLMGAWDSAASLVNSHRKTYRPLLAQNANLPVALKKHYRMNSYPHHQLPAPQDVAAVLAWMQSHGMLKTRISYSKITWTP